MCVYGGSNGKNSNFMLCGVEINEGPEKAMARV